ncbi:MAG: hypothetical protein OXG98_10560 [Gemmatimonadetes bacterium]|nr:hypothetical protein [Gemmatimonadota bacterium]
MSCHTFFGFKLKDAVRGLKRALRDENIPVVSVREADDRVVFAIDVASETGEIILAYHTTKSHPLARLGDIPAIEVTVDDHLPDVKPVLTMAFLRGGG